MGAPCKDCPDRVFDPDTGESCRKTCDRWAAYEEKKNAAAAEKARQQAATPVLCRKVVKQIYRGMKRK